MSCRAIPACAPSRLAGGDRGRDVRTVAVLSQRRWRGPAVGQAGLRLPRLDSRPFNPLLDHLPAVIKTEATATKAPTGSASSSAWRAANRRTSAPGGEGVLAKLSELCSSRSSASISRRCRRNSQAGWPACAILRRQGAVLLHGNPARDWTIEDLARTSGAVALGPGRAVRRSGRPAADPVSHQVAHADRRGPAERRQHQYRDHRRETGFSSEAAFSRAFKKMVGVPPSAWRHRAGQVPAQKA